MPAAESLQTVSAFLSVHILIHQLLGVDRVVGVAELFEDG
jgi:hypothetical protein